MIDNDKWEMQRGEDEGGVDTVPWYSSRKNPGLIDGFFDVHVILIYIMLILCYTLNYLTMAHQPARWPYLRCSNKYGYE
jgi:hypothetical protein